MNRLIILLCLFSNACVLVACSQVSAGPTRELKASIRSIPYDATIPGSLPAGTLIVDTICVGSHRVRILGLNLAIVSVTDNHDRGAIVTECVSGLYNRNYVYIIIYKTKMYVSRIVAIPPSEFKDHLIIDHLPTISEVTSAVSKEKRELGFTLVDQAKIYVDDALIESIQAGEGTRNTELVPLEAFLYQLGD